MWIKSKGINPVGMTYFENQFGFETLKRAPGSLAQQRRRVYGNSSEHPQTKAPGDFSHTTISTKQPWDVSRRQLLLSTGACAGFAPSDALTRGTNAIGPFMQRAFLVG
jgi:hypothetical protein